MSSSEINEQTAEASVDKEQVERHWQGSPFNDQLLKIVLIVNVLLLVAVPALFVYNAIQNSKFEVLVGNAESKALEIPLHIWAVWFCITAVVFCGELFYSRYSEEEIDSSKWGFAATLEAEEEAALAEEETEQDKADA